MPGQYAEPLGCILLAWDNGCLVGSVAVRPTHKADLCEMKRLYLRERWRGRGIGRQLAEGCLSFAREAGYAKMVLDTEPRLETAIRMYRKLGFVGIAQYYENPLKDIIFMEKEL